MFITNPGRMGDEDGTTFVIQNGNEFSVYRVDGWLYPSKKEKQENRISMNDNKNQFPKWLEAWKHSKEKDYKGKYTYILWVLVMDYVLIMIFMRRINHI